MIDHLGFDVSDYEASKRFYQEALPPLGYELLVEFEGGVAGFGKQGKPDLWIATRGEPQSGVHGGFVSSDRETVDRFYEAAIAAGGAEADHAAAARRAAAGTRLRARLVGA